MTTNNDRFQEVKVTGETVCRKYVRELEEKGLVAKAEAVEITRPMVEVVTWNEKWEPVIVLVEKF